MYSRVEIYAYLYLLEGKSNYLFNSELITKEMAYRNLKEWTDEDFGYDTATWEDYFSQFNFDNLDEVRIAFKGRTRRIEQQKNKSEKIDKGSNENDQ